MIGKSSVDGALFGLFLFVTILAWRSATSGDARNALAWVTGTYLLLLMVLPSQWKSLGLITERVGTFAFLTWVLALAGQRYERRARRVTIVAAQVLAVVLIARWTVTVHVLDDYVEEYRSVAAHIEPARRILELNFATRGRSPGGGRLSHPVAPFAHTIGLVGAQRNAVILNDYEALTAVFPLKYRSASGELLKSTLHDPPDFRMTDLEQFEQATCLPIDYVVVWQADRNDAHTRALLRDLGTRYDLTYVSRPGSHAQVLTRRGTVSCG